MTKETIGIKPDPRKRVNYPIGLLGVDNETLLVGCFVAMQETGTDGYLYREGRFVRVVVAASVEIEIESEKGGV